MASVVMASNYNNKECHEHHLLCMFYKLEGGLVFKDGRNEHALKKLTHDFICGRRNNSILLGLFNDALSAVDYTALNDSVLTVQPIGKEVRACTSA
jgi:hypothetical protein